MEKLLLVLCTVLFYQFVVPKLSYICRRVWGRLKLIYYTAVFVWGRFKLIYYGAVFVWKTFKVFGFKNGCRCARLVIRDICN